jgi:MerR family transcriptional regulator, repressor of the yfmOP operon
MADESTCDGPAALAGDLAIGKAAALADVSTRTLRYYEQLGLLTPSARTAGGARRYSPGDVLRLLRIRELQYLMGFNLTDIQSIVAAEDRLQSLCEEFRAETPGERKRDIALEAIGVTDNLRAQVAEKLDKVRAFLAALDDRTGRYRAYLDKDSES